VHILIKKTSYMEETFYSLSLTVNIVGFLSCDVWYLVTISSECTVIISLKIDNLCYSKTWYSPNIPYGHIT
jgi:hypothetical protein